MPDAIKRFKGQFAFLSNFYVHPFEYCGVVYPTVEHAFQAAKTDSPEWKKLIQLARTPRDAKKLGRQCPMRDDWDQVKLHIMKQILSSKFNNPELARQLIETGSAVLVEGNTWGDQYWGATGPRFDDGANWLGRLLMEIRRDLLLGHTAQGQIESERWS